MVDQGLPKEGEGKWREHSGFNKKHAKSRALEAKKSPKKKPYKHHWMGEMKFDEEGNRQH